MGGRASLIQQKFVLPFFFPFFFKVMRKEDCDILVYITSLQQPIQSCNAEETSQQIHALCIYIYTELIARHMSTAQVNSMDSIILSAQIEPISPKAARRRRQFVHTP